MRAQDLFDIAELQRILDDFSAIADTPTAILDIEGNILAASGWRDICTAFHRVHPTTAARCRESDTRLAGQLHAGEPFNVYRCENGLVDVATPIRIGGVHVANFFIGQFLLEPPDLAAFELQAESVGFDKAAYREALAQVPIIPMARIQRLMAFLSRLVALIGGLGLARLTAQAQARDILDMSAPVLPVWRGVLVVPLVGTLDSARAQVVTERLLEGVVSHEAEVVLLDITGVPAVDTRMAQHLVETARAVRLLGGRVILTGIRPPIALTLVHLGVDLSTLVTRASLAAGLHEAFRMLGIQ